MCFIMGIIQSYTYTHTYRIVLPAAEEGSDAMVENEWMTALLYIHIAYI